MTQCIPGIIQYNRYSLYEIGKLSPTKPDTHTLATFKQLGILKFRGTRGGQNKRTWDLNDGVNLKNIQTLPQEIPTIVPICTLSPNTNPENPRTNHENENSSQHHDLTKIKCDSITVCKGQTYIKVCCINPRSVKNKSLALSDYISSNDYDIVAVTETWLGGSSDKSCIAELVPSGYKIKHVPRCGRGGGVAVVYKTSLDIQILTSTNDKVFTTFEHMECTVSI